MLTSMVGSLLTQSATVRVRAQSWDLHGNEAFGTAAITHGQEPCLVVDLSPQEATMRGLDIAQRPARLYFGGGTVITEDDNHQRYQQVEVEIGRRVYTVMGYEEEPPADAPADVAHVSVVAIRREAADV